ncbi:hypothetical protein [Actinoallomurus iriomotensis]|uniref:DUF3558 domain-containing protein n=1 Tax=Actinoallomurus iriomotensis TaxID=478107 RepID=A0A9W6RZT7_9ACTN|nr:hypothetical protein [Actinoallomurus iriomotensis]GLY85275.1 hypothetical protein Airi02_032040 [Actinoallomurus iriomotensis]
MTRGRFRIVLAGAVAIVTAGCATTGSGGEASPSRTSIGSSAPIAPSPSPTFRPGEIRSVPDPRTLFSPALRKALRFDEYDGSECKQDKGDAERAEYIDVWSCDLFTPRGREADADLLAVYTEFHHPIPHEDATTFATSDFAATRENSGPEWSPVALGDEALQAPASVGAGRIRLRVRNVTLEVSAYTGDWRRRSSTEEDRRGRRAATDLIRSLTRRVR